MARLFYEPINVSGHRDTSQTKGAGFYFEKVIKLIPSEIVGAYIFLSGIVQISSKNEHLYILITFILCLFLTPLYIYAISEKKKPVRDHMLLSSLAFIVWAYATSGNNLFRDFYEPFFASIAIVVFTITSGLITLRK